MTALAWFGFAVGLVLVLTTYGSVVETTILPRGTQSSFSALVLRSVSFPIRFAAALVRDFEARDRLLAYAAALFLVFTLLAWLLLFLVGFALILWPFSANIGDALRIAASSMLTLGIAAPSGSGPLVVVYLAALTGLVVIALQIAYLPVLYAAYNRRETLVTMLEGLAGTPGWGPEILMRSAAVDNVAGLGSIYDRWMEWAADVSESHSAYRVLLYFRSPVSRRSDLNSSFDHIIHLQLLCPGSSAALQLIKKGPEE